MKIRIATRASPLALAQTEQVRDLLRARAEALEFETMPMTTSGDDWSRRRGEDAFSKGMFVRELEQALLDGRADLAVHSMKDLPQTLPSGLVIAAVGRRIDARDAVVGASSLAELPAASRIGTSSLRRRQQLAAAFGELDCVPMRGNIETRLRKLADGECEALVLAAAGLQRLGLEARIKEHLPPEVCLPAAGQGALALQTRADDQRLIELLQTAHHAPSAECVAAERALCLGLGADCASALGAYADFEGERIRLRAVVCEAEGDARAEFCARGDKPQALGEALAEEILAHPAGAWLKP